MELSFRSSLLIMTMIHFETVVRIDDYENKGERRTKKNTTPLSLSSSLLMMMMMIQFGTGYYNFTIVFLTRLEYYPSLSFSLCVCLQVKTFKIHIVPVSVWLFKLLFSSKKKLVNTMLLKKL